MNAQQDPTCSPQTTVRSRWPLFDGCILTRVVTSLTPYLRPLVLGLVLGRHGESEGPGVVGEDV